LSRFRLIGQGVDVSAINDQLDAQPDLWGQNPARTNDPNSPHHGIPDIWARWRAPDEPADDAPHFACFWPAWRALPALHSVVHNLSRVVGSVHLGGILVTSTPGGGQVRPHVDSGWHARFYNCKLYLVLRSNPLCLNWCDGEAENFRGGDVWTYPNDVLHSVENQGTTPHTNVIICCRIED